MNNENLFGGTPKNDSDNLNNAQSSEQSDSYADGCGVSPEQGVNNTSDIPYINNSNTNISYGNQYNSQYSGNPNVNNQFDNQHGVNTNVNASYDNNQIGSNPCGNQSSTNPYDSVSYGNQPNNNPYGGAPYGNQSGNDPYGNQINDNRYAQSEAPQVQYMPLTPGTVLPQGVQPVYMNGGWYYPVANLQMPPKKKMPLSIKVLLGVIIALTLGFIVALCAWVGHLEANGDGGLDSFFYQMPTESATTKKYTDDTAYIYANPNGPEIELKDNKTKDGSAEKAYEKLSESVVSISVYSLPYETPEDSAPVSEGTGIIISDDGYIITNSHVILDDLESNVWVKTKSGEEYSTVVVGIDVRTDLAVILCEEAVDWQPAEFADSEQLKVGQEVVAIGSPGGADYSNSITRGVISALDRPLAGNAGEYIQTDTAINPGNSGGPLANLNGQVIGVNTIKVVDTEYEGMGFAIPSKTIKEIADQLIKNGYVKGRVKLGIMAGEISSAFAKAYSMDMGISIESIDDDSPLKATDVEENDIITKIDGKAVPNFAELYNVLDEYEDGDKVTLTICRYNQKKPSENETFTVEITLVSDQG